MSLFSESGLNNANYSPDRYKGTSRALLDEIPLSMRYGREAPAPLSLADGSGEHAIPISSRYQQILLQKGEQLDQKPPNFVKDSLNVIDIHRCSPKLHAINQIPKHAYDSVNRSFTYDLPSPTSDLNASLPLKSSLK